MNKNILKALAIIAGVVALSFLIYKGVQNKIDPVWLQVDSVFVKRSYTIAEKAEALDSIFYTIQKDKSFREKKIHAIDLIKKPFLPTTEYTKFADFLMNFYKNRRVLVSGVSGAGKTTIVDRIARLIAADTSKILYLQCVEQMSVEYNKQYIGSYDGKVFHKGKLLEMFEQCNRDTLHNYVFIVDDIDKIYPSTLFGSALWSEMDNPDYNNPIEGYTTDIKIPVNFYLLSVTHDGVGSTIELNAEHYRRLTNDNPYHIGASFLELYLGMKEDTIKKIKKSKKLSELQKKEMITAISDNHYDASTRDSIHTMLYFFSKSNLMIEGKYENSYTLGQWSSLRKQKRPSQLNKSMQLFIEHVNAFKPKEQLKEEDFKPVFYTIRHHGLMPDSSVIYNIYASLVSMGILNEISVTILFGAISAIIGISAFRKKKKFIKGIINDSVNPVRKFKEKETSYDEAKGTLLLIQKNIEEYIIKKKINFSEANYLLLTIGEQLKQLEDYHNLDSASVELKKMFDEFMEDNILNEKEYQVLSQFLNGIRNTISRETYNNLQKQIEDTYLLSLAKTKQGENK